ncbi:uncharacterized protein DFE_2753 [Desulfovibrio ferrophilus]|uniref:D,L-carboxypeptidase peptidase domain-containing protein n=1 Tax=Desulfovibrio ferrophilus TaxID=241368 RepID=A0A2Z6B1T3_9BACT|nr:uncharacterized protein DFE_2753 [Desulfovibrio ferrophilus]
MAALVVSTVAFAGDAPRRHTFFSGTQYPLTVHFIQGTEPGPTVMVQGGIQGDEVSGYLTAQILTHAEVIRGNLIVIPRANVPTVLAGKREINVDLNRRFDQDYNTFYEDRLARVIRFLLKRSDAFVHLHEGSGFYHPTYVDGLRNPRRYGQSIIIDTPVFEGRINLAQVATSVLGQLNHSIVPAYQFKLFNTNTFANNTTHPEQRKSLTFHALSSAGIPALAIEVSKNIRQLGWKVLQQLRATVLTLEQYGVELRLPEFTEQEVDRYARTASRLRVNGLPVIPGKDLTLPLAPGGTVAVTVEDAGDSTFDPVPAVFASDRPDLNMVSAPRLALSRFGRLDVRADGTRVSRVNVAWQGQWQDKAPTPGTPVAKGAAPLFACWLNGKLRFVPADGVLEAVQGDQLVLEGVWGSRKDQEEVLNFKGYVSQPRRNDGQDAGQEIVLDSGAFIGRYVKAAKDGSSWLCRVVRETPGEPKTQFKVRFVPRSVSALGLLGEDGDRIIVPWTGEGRYVLPAGTYTLEGLWSNGPKDKVLATNESRPLPWGGGVTVAPGLETTITLRQATTFRPIGRMTLAAQ